MPFRIIRSDITKVKADAIVNSANPEPIIGGGTDSAVYLAAGAAVLLAERRKIGNIATGEAAVTSAFGLPARYIIHTVGPVWQGGESGEFDALASCYRKSLLLAEKLGCESIAFPLISTGIYGFPKDRALTVALDVISSFLERSEMDVTLVVFDRSAYELSSALVEDVRQYIDEKYVREKEDEEYSPAGRIDAAFDEMKSPISGMSAHMAPPELQNAHMAPPELQNAHMAPLPEPQEAVRRKAKASGAFRRPAAPAPSGAQKKQERAEDKGRASLRDRLRHLGDSFQQQLLHMIDEKGYTDTEVYKRANIDRKLFSKIRCSEDYTPKKRTALALAVALRLNLDETVDLLGRAGLALSPSSKMDLIVQYCIENRMYDINKINALLFEYDQPILGS